MADLDFVTQFYNLEGDLVSERKKNFFKLLKSQPHLSEDDLKHLCPRTHLERLFQIEIFIHFKMYSKLLDVIRKGNEIFISKILKHPPLLLEVIGNISPETFVNDFLPSTSYSLRMKILKKISFVLSEEQMDEIVTAAHKRYGLYIATKLVHTCSSKKIRDFLSNHEVTLKPRQVKFIFDKDPELFIFYLNYYKASTGNAYSHTNVCKYVALKNPKLWFQLQKENTTSHIHLGRRTSKHFLRHTNDDLCSNVQDFSQFLKLEVIVRKLHGSFKEVYFEHFPKETYNINTYNFSHSLLKHFPKRRQWDMFAQTYLRIFKNDILNDLKHLSADFMYLFPNKTVMNKWAAIHYKNHKSNDMLKYCDPNVAIPLIKEKINVTSDIHERKLLIKLLLQNCQKNDDLTSLETVLKYICFRHRNEENTMDILDEIRNLFDIEKLNNSHWNHINEMITILKLRKLSFYYVETFYLKYVEYLILQGQPFRKELIMYIEEVEENSRNFNIDLKNKKVEKRIIIEIIIVYRDVIKITDVAYKEKFINIIIDFNEKNTEDTITLSDFQGFTSYVKSLLDTDFKELEDSTRNLLIKVVNYNFRFPENPIIIIEETRILQIFRQAKYSFNQWIQKCIKKVNRSTFENKVLEYFWDSLKSFESSYFCSSIIHWLLLNDPRSIAPHFDRIWTVSQSYIKAKDVKLMSHFGFDTKLIEYATNELVYLDDFFKYVLGRTSSEMEIAGEVRRKIDTDKYENIIEHLCVLLTTDEYIEIISKRFLPVKEKINVRDASLNEIYVLQCEVAKSLKKLQEPATVLPTVMKFCLGDYLQSALPSLYSICYKAPEEQLYSYVDVLSKRAVSARKHALFLSCELLNYNDVLSRLQRCDENNVSSQKHMFSATLKYFNKNPCEELLNLVARNLNTIDENDKETLQSLVNIVVPKKYKTEYIQRCWYFFENLRLKDVNVESYLQLFFSNITYSLDINILLPVDFCKHIITHYFKNPPDHDHHLNDINRFVCLFLRNMKSEQENNSKFIFDIISSFKTVDIKKFFNEFYSCAVDDVQRNRNIDTVNNYHIELFKQRWFNMFTPIKMFNEHVLLNLFYLKCKPSDNIVENYAKEVVNYLEELIAEYGPYIYYKFKDLVLHKHTFTREETYLFLYNILKFKKSTVNCMLVLDLIKTQSSNEEVKVIHDEIMAILKNSDEPVVSVYFNSYFG